MAAINKNFVVRNGIEIGDNLIYGDKANLKVGIGTTVPQYTLDVRGGIGATNVSVGQTITANVGIITNLIIEGGTFVAGGSAGTNGQYLKSTSTGVEWSSFPTTRTTSTFTATEGQTSFSFAYNVGFVDVFVNGVRLTDVEFTATDGLTIILNTPRRVGDIVDVVGYSITGVGAGTSGIGGITIRDEGITIGSANAVTSINFVGASVTSVGTGAGVTVIIASANAAYATYAGYAETAGISTTARGLTTTANINTSGIATIGNVVIGGATTALIVTGDARVTGILTVGTASITIDGDSNTLTVPNLVVTNSTTGVTASGVGITIRDGGGDLGAAEIIDFGDNLSVSFFAGIATITGSASVGSGGTWASNSVGIYTSRNVGIGTTNPTSALTVKGNTFLETLNVSGIATISGDGTNAYLRYGSSNAYTNFVTTYNVSQIGGVPLISVDTSGAALSADTTLNAAYWRVRTKSTGAEVNGTLEVTNLVSSGIVTASSFSGSNTLKERTVISGITTEIANNGIGNTNISGYKSYALMKVGLSTAGWLRLYTDSASRTADVSRSVGIDPTPGSGVIAEVVTTGITTTQIISPFVMGGNLDDPADTTIYAAITNLSGVTTSISVNLTLLQLEA
jgi:hypothetical protein